MDQGIVRPHFQQLEQRVHDLHVDHIRVEGVEKGIVERDGREIEDHLDLLLFEYGLHHAEIPRVVAVHHHVVILVQRRLEILHFS